MSVNGNAGEGAQEAAPKGLQLELTLMKGGVDKDIPTGSNMMVGGQSISQPALSTELGQDLTLYTAVDQAHAQLKAAVATLNAAIPGMRQRYQEMKAAILSQLGTKSPQLADFGIRPRKAPAPQTAAEKALAAAKRAATREARGIVGKNKRAAVVGATPTLTIGPGGTTVTPGNGAATSSAPAASSGSATPASGGTSSGH